VGVVTLPVPALAAAQGITEGRLNQALGVRPAEFSGGAVCAIAER
jgi:hypothetical protein